MPRYVAFLRGVSPLNAKMPELKRCFETAGFTNVRTVLSSGNVVFDARSASETSIVRRAESSMRASLGRTFYTIVRRSDSLLDLLQADPFAAHAVSPGAKRVVSFFKHSGGFGIRIGKGLPHTGELGTLSREQERH